MDSNWKENLLKSRSIEIIHWALPLVSAFAMREGFFRDAKAKYNDILYWSETADWKMQFTTPNSSNYYIYSNINTSDGPVVLDFPAADGAGLFGTILDTWQVPMIDVGSDGEDKGKGAKYLVLPPDYNGDVPAEYVPVPSKTFNNYALFRVVPKTSSDADKEISMALVKKISFYSFSQASNPPQVNYIDMVGKLLDGTVMFDDSFFTMLAKAINEEPIFKRDLVAYSMLASIGIEKGKPFEPDYKAKELLKSAAEEAHQIIMSDSRTTMVPFWEGAHWGLHKTIGPQTGFSFLSDDGNTYDIYGRALIYFLGFGIPKNLGGATFYLTSYVDNSNQVLSGENTYCLHVPADVPAKQFWATTVYDAETSCFIRETPRTTLDSYNQSMERNNDGSVDIYFGPTAPAGKEDNWIYTHPGKQWVPIFRFYLPDKQLFDKTWSMGDIEKI